MIDKLSTKTKYSSRDNIKNITTYFTTPNQPPQLDTIRVRINQDETYSFNQLDILNFFTDFESSQPLNILILSNPTKGRLKFDNKDIEINQVIAFSNISNLTYTPPVGVYGIEYCNFFIKVNDDGLPPNPYSEAVRVVVDIIGRIPPIVEDNCIEVIENQDYQFQLIDFSIGYQDDNTVEPEYISFIELPNSGQIISNTEHIFTDPFTTTKTILPNIEYRPTLGIYEDFFYFKVGDEQALFSDLKKMCIKIKSIPTLLPIHILQCFGDSLIIKDKIIDNYINNDGSGIKHITITYLHSGYSLLLNGVQVTINQIIPVNQLDNLILEVTNSNSANRSITFNYTATSINEITSLENTFIATIGMVADFDCSDFDKDDFFTFDE